MYRLSTRISSPALLHADLLSIALGWRCGFNGYCKRTHSSYLCNDGHTDDDFRVISIAQGKPGGKHLFFRITQQRLVTVIFQYAWQLHQVWLPVQTSLLPDPHD